MGGIGDAVAALLDPDLGVEIVIFAHEVLDHRLDIGGLTALVLGAEAVQPEKRLA